MVGGSEIIFIFLMVLVLFGANKIPEFAKTLGKGMREFKKATDEIKEEINKHSEGAGNDIQNIKTDLIKPLEEVKTDLNTSTTLIKDNIEKPV
jgi:TatA/E family protein of Tat protein translocase